MVTNTILLDVGGTFIKRSDGRMFHIDSGGNEEAVSKALSDAVEIPNLGRVGVAIPGPFDYKEGVFLMKHKFASVYGKSFRALAGIPDGVQMVFHHDVNALLLGAVKMLGLHGRNTALVTLGTGLGFAYAIGGQVQYAPSGSPARGLWNLPAEEGGILEDYVSARGISRAYALRTGDNAQSARAIAQRAYSGEEDAIAVYEEMGDRLGKALGNALADLDASTVLMGGQISQSLSLFQASMQDHLNGITILNAPQGAVFEGLSTLFI